MSDPQAALNASRVADIPIVTIVRVMNALKAVGYSVVELPKDPHPFSVGPDGDVWDGDLNESYSPAEARIMASRLLAAADAADAEPDPHAGQLWVNELQSRQRQVPSDREWS